MRGDTVMHCRYAERRDAATRERLVHRYLPLARYAASRYAHGAESFDDLMQVASIGLLKAIDRYDPERGIAFASFALPTMSGELRRHLRDRSWAVRPPRALQEQALAVEGAVERLTARLGRSPTPGQVADTLGITEEAVLEALEAGRARTPVSLSAPSRGQADDPRTLEDRLGKGDPGLAAVEARDELHSLTAILAPREREILRLRFADDLTQTEIAQRVGISQMHVSRILRRTLERLRAAAA